MDQKQQQQQQPQQQTQQPQQSRSLPESASRTLFLMEIPQDITEEELQTVFCKEPGFIDCRIRQDRNQQYTYTSTIR
jgi:hypothetical protein